LSKEVFTGGEHHGEYLDKKIVKLHDKEVALHVLVVGSQFGFVRRSTERYPAHRAIRDRFTITSLGEIVEVSEKIQGGPPWKIIIIYKEEAIIVIIMSLIYISIIIIVIIIESCSSSNIVTFSASRKLIRNLNECNINCNDFKAWFSDSNRPQEILELNPGIEKMIKLDNNKYKGYLSPIKFPGLLITSMVDFDIYFDGSRLEVNCFDDSLVQEYQGSKLLISIISKLIPKVKSTNILTINEANNELINEATLNIIFSIPSWFVKKDVLEAKGSEAIGENIESDLNKLLDKIILVYKRTN
jgi:hypothetical protein